MSFKKLILFMPGMVKESPRNALERFFGELKEAKTHMSQQAFSLARQKLKWEALEELFHAGVEGSYNEEIKDWRGWMLMAVDESRVALPPDAEPQEYYGTAGNGGGVNIWEAIFTMTGGTINDNTGEHGGGVHINGSGTFTMTDGTISGNTGEYGGGVRLYKSTFTKTGGAIYGNDADGNSNSAGIQNGHAVELYNPSTERYRNATLGPGDNISTGNLYQLG